MKKLHDYKIGDKIKFKGERNRYTVRECNERYAICTKPFNVRHSVLYTIIDFKEGIRGTDGYIFGLGWEAENEIRESFDYFVSQGGGVSRRNRVVLTIE